MKTKLSSPQALTVAAGLLASAFSHSSHAQTTAATEPIGVMKVAIAAASSTTTPRTATLSVPAYGTADFKGLVASVDGASQFTLAAGVPPFAAVPSWTVNQFADPAGPRLVRVKASATSSHVGKFFLVSGNTATGQLQVVLPSGVGTVATYVSVGDSCEVLPANTLGTLFGTASTVFATGSTSAAADNIQLFNGTSWDTYFHNGTSWVKNVAGTPIANDDIVYPDEGMVVLRRLTSPLSLSLAGTVPVTAEQSPLTAAVGTTRGTTFLANRFPVATTLKLLGLPATSNWTSGSSAASADNVLIWNGTAWDTYYYTGQQWRNSKKSGDRGATAIPANTAIQVTRRSTSASVLTQALPYTP